MKLFLLGRFVLCLWLVSAVCCAVVVVGSSERQTHTHRPAVFALVLFAVDAVLVDTRALVRPGALLYYSFVTLSFELWPLVVLFVVGRVV